MLISPVLPAWIPSLPWSVPVVSPAMPRSSRNAVTPLWPFDRSTEAKTRKWSAMSARLIQIFWPLRTVRLAVAPRRRARGCRHRCPTPGSVRPKVASLSPFAWGTSQRCCCSSVPHCWSVSELSPTWTLWTTRKAVSAFSSSSQIMREADVVHPAAAPLRVDRCAQEALLGHPGEDLAVDLALGVPLPDVAA